MVHLHGGGWTFGSVDTHDRLMRLLALAADAAVLGVDYRLAPEQPFPAPLEDSLAALRWARVQAKELGVDGERIVLIAAIRPAPTSRSAVCSPCATPASRC